VEHYGPVASKNLRGVLRQELLCNFGFEHMFLMADVLIDRFLEIIQDAEAIHGPLEPFHTVVYGYDSLKKFTYARQPYRVHLRGTRVSIITADEIAQLIAGASLPSLRSHIAVRILRSPVKSSTCSGHAVHSSERSDASEIIVRQLVGMGKGESDLRRESPVRASR
jgi:hypothetical protein